ncbi:MAG: DNA-formamidopyrimidine glycosylase family protein [Phycisphaerales bacterium]
MPELPEVERLRRSLVPRIVGRVVVGVSVRRRDVVVGPGDPAGGYQRSGRGGGGRDGGAGGGESGGGRRFPRLDRRVLLLGMRVEGVERLGKQLGIMGSDGGGSDGGGGVVVHLGMTGTLLHSVGGGKGRGAGDHVHVVWSFDDGGVLAFRDPRRFGGVWGFRTVAELRERRWGVLGVDALAIDGPGLGAALAGSKASVKARLLDQRVVAGIGNIYADEALHAAGISPMRAGGLVETDECDRLAAAVRSIMGRAIEAGGSTLRDYRDADGVGGAFQLEHRVYGRGGEACLGCGGVLERGVVAQRTTVWCPVCQR